MVNNLLLVLFTLTVLIGTVFPLVVEAVSGKQMSVGRPYFDKMSVPIGVALLLLMGVGPALPWGRASKEQIRRSMLLPAIVGVVLAVFGYIAGLHNGWAVATLLFGGFAGMITLREIWLPSRQRWRSGNRNLADVVLTTQLKHGRRRFGAYVIHAAVIVTIVAIAISSTMQTSKQVDLRQGESATVGAYTLTFLGADMVNESHRQAIVSRVAVNKGGTFLTTLTPKMNYYEMSREPIGSPSVRTGAKEDLYLSVLNVDPQAQTIALQVIINPMVGWIWLCTGIMALGALLIVVPMKRRAGELGAKDEAVAGGGIHPAAMAYGQEK